MKQYWKGYLLLTVFFAACFLAGSRVHADTVSLHLASKHITESGIDYGFNETNPGLGYGLTITDNFRVITGAYHNSMRRVSTYGCFEFYTRFNNRVITEIGLDLGYVSGYRTDMPIGGAVYARLGDLLNVNLIPLVIPHPIKGTFVDGVVFGFSLTFGK